MRIDSQLLIKLRALRDARNAGNVLPACINLATLKEARKGIWAEIRRRYSLPDNVKFKVELDGADAGELRRKDTSEAYTPPTPAPASAAHVPQSTDVQRFLIVDVDDETFVDGVPALLDYLRNNSDIRVVAL